jgi:uncharacterized lipoprotein YbaY
MTTNLLRRAIGFAALGLAALLLAGCAGPVQRVAANDRAALKSVRINEQVTKAEHAFLLAPNGANVGLMFGAIGGAAAASSIDAPRRPFEEFLARSDISIEKIVREELQAELQRSGKMAFTTTPGQERAVLNIQVAQYGFGVTHLLGSSVVPVLMVKCELTQGGNRVVWSAGDRLLPSVAHPMASVPWESLRNNPALIEDQWRKAARLLAKNIAATL